MVKILGLFLGLILAMSSGVSEAAQHAHAKHNMILFGENSTYYASHIVYKDPHHFQVILNVRFNSRILAELADEMKAHPSDEFIFLLDPMDMSQMTQKPAIYGKIFRNAADGAQQIISERVDLRPEEYSVIYFNELPLSLSNKLTSSADLASYARIGAYSVFESLSAQVDPVRNVKSGNSSCERKYYPSGGSRYCLYCNGVKVECGTVKGD